MGEYLAGHGYTVLGLRLAAHATRPEDMLRARWRDWMANVEDGWHILNGQTEKIFVIGLSMGGVLSLLFASQYSVAGVVAMSTLYALPSDPRLRFIKLLRWLQPSVPKGPPDWHNPDAARDHIDYPDYPTRALVELRDVLAELRKALPKVSAPTLLVHSRQDTSVDPSNMQMIYDHLGTNDKHMLRVEDSGHVITREPQRELVFKTANDFIQRVIRRI